MKFWAATGKPVERLPSYPYIRNPAGNCVRNIYVDTKKPGTRPRQAASGKGSEAR